MSEKLIKEFVKKFGSMSPELRDRLAKRLEEKKIREDKYRRNKI